MLRRDRMNGISVSQCILGMAELEEIRMIQSSELQSDRGDQKGLVRLCRDGVDMGMILAIMERILSLYVVVHFECICVTFWGTGQDSSLETKLICMIKLLFLLRDPAVM
jgi:hypothetical protein